jgi:hypothetical protein
MAVANTPAYYDTATIKKFNSTLGVSALKLFFFVTDRGAK